MSAARRLLTLLADGKFHSGEELGRKLGVSRTAVWKSLRTLQSDGIKMDAVQGRGYRLRARLELLDLHAIEASLTPDARAALGSMEVLYQVNSTNSWLMAQAGSAAQGSLCLAEMQTGGRGRRGRSWVSPFGANLYLSLLWRFNEGPARLGGLSLAVGVACARALGRLGASSIRLKWPNDLLWDGRKLGGILLEVAGESNGPCDAVMGIGINIGMPAGTRIDQPWADAREIVPDMSRNELAVALVEELVALLRRFELSGFEDVREEWSKHDAFAGCRISLNLPNSRVSGIARGVDPGGHLLLETGMGLERFASGEISLRGE